MQENTENKNTTGQLETGTYEILRDRLKKNSEELKNRLEKLNLARKEVFGTIETSLLSTERITTQHSCIPADMVSFGTMFLFGYNVHIGLKTELNIVDVFAVFNFENSTFVETNLNILQNNVFIEDFKNLYRYYKNTRFSKFAVIGNFLYMIFRVGKSFTDIKTFKWAIENNSITYLNNRSDHEYKFPEQHEFKWIKTTRENHIKGKYPHVSIENRVFVETTGGDLTIKIENNTDTGQGIYAELVENKDQTLDDAEFFYAIIGNIIVLKIRPFQEKNYRYFVFNEKVQQALRIDAIEHSCVLLPDGQGIIFANGYYLQTGEYKIFENDIQNMLFERKIPSPNGEDFLFIFYNREIESYILLSYNIIAQKVETPVICTGYTIFKNGQMCYFHKNGEPKRHHTIQIWQTPYYDSDTETIVKNDSFIYKIGNKDIVRAMAECNETLVLIRKEDSYMNLYLDLVKRTTLILDAYHWLNSENVFKLSEPLSEIRTTANAAIEEYDKVLKIRKHTANEVQRITELANELLQNIKRKTFDSVVMFVNKLAKIRSIRGEVISLKELRYVDLLFVENFDKQLNEANDSLSQRCVEFLLKDDALNPYKANVETIKQSIEKVAKVVEADSIEENIDNEAAQLELLIEIVSNLKINDTTQTTRIIDNISAIYSIFNQLRAALRRKRTELFSNESKAEFNAQLKLINQAIINYIDLCDTPEKTDEYLSKLMVQLEELEGKFSEFEEFVSEVSTKREEVYNAFETKKINLIEQRNKRADNLHQSALRILKAIHNRISRFKTLAEINGYYAADLMIEKVRDIIAKLLEMNDTVKADDVESRLKTVKEDAIRQLKDRNELFVEGDNMIKFGNFNFLVNTQQPEVTMVLRNNTMYYHLTGTGLFEQVENKQLAETAEVWNQTIVSENIDVYRSEYLAFTILQNNQHEKLFKLNDNELQAEITNYISVRYNEGYIKGIHDNDAFLILKNILYIEQNAGLLRYAPNVRACALLFWNVFVDEINKDLIQRQAKSIANIISAFPKSSVFQEFIDYIFSLTLNFVTQTKLFPIDIADEAAEYLFLELTSSKNATFDIEAQNFYDAFMNYLRNNRLKTTFDNSCETLKQNPKEKYQLIKNWLKAFVSVYNVADANDYIDETATAIFLNDVLSRNLVKVSLKVNIQNMQGTHQTIENQNYTLHYSHFIEKLRNYTKVVIPKFNFYNELKKKLLHNFEEDLRLNEFKPRVLTSFVRNKLIDKVFLPLVGNNLAKQIGAAGSNKRTDLMGLLLLISPPGYGKTTLMEYVANRLGIIFMKINGPALGHEVTSVDPQTAPNSGAKEELLKLNLAFEMGDNVMIYIDDIQHCNPEFLQKFISLSDAQRKIEGVYKGKSKTYDFRGKKVCIIMAGNPYTESGEKFKIPDMLANRADIYNLGDIIGGTANEFLLSYIENSLTANPILSKLAGKSQKDVYTMLTLAETGSKEGLEFEASHSSEEVNEYVNVLKKLMRVRDVISIVNQQYIASAAQQDEYRTEPSFRLQGSYRDMNKIAAKVMPVMNNNELEQLIFSHYDNESQTLTSGAEANMLKFKEMLNILSPDEQKRWNDIKNIFLKQQQAKGYGSNQTALIVNQFENLTNAINNISKILGK